VPRRLDEDARDMLGRLAGSVGDDAYRGDDGFFQRLKSTFR
jgi:hypothetical protein